MNYTGNILITQGILFSIKKQIEFILDQQNDYKQFTSLKTYKLDKKNSIYMTSSFKFDLKQSFIGKTYFFIIYSNKITITIDLLLKSRDGIRSSSNDEIEISVEYKRVFKKITKRFKYICSDEISEYIIESLDHPSINKTLFKKDLLELNCLLSCLMVEI